MSLQDAINEILSFLKEQISPEEQPFVNGTFEIQIETIRTANCREINGFQSKSATSSAKLDILDELPFLYHLVIG
jgi:hypothetical protein